MQELWREAEEVRLRKRLHLVRRSWIGRVLTSLIARLPIRRRQTAPALTRPELTPEPPAPDWPAIVSQQARNELAAELSAEVMNLVLQKRKLYELIALRNRLIEDEEHAKDVWQVPRT
jgi:hypothetical protein